MVRSRQPERSYLGLAVDHIGLCHFRFGTTGMLATFAQPLMFASFS